MLSDPASLGIAAASLLLVVGLVAGLGRAIRAAGLAGAGAAGRRLAVIEAVAIDPKRRLVLLRCDGREALVLTGPAGDLLLEAPR